jgi:hypothetical protein
MIRNWALLTLLSVFVSCQSTKTTTDENVAVDPSALSFGTKKVSLETLSTIVPEKTLNYMDPFGNGEQSVVGVPLHLALDSFLGPSWRDLDGILFTSRDGYKIDIPIAKILRYRPLLAYKYLEGRAFTAIKDNQITELGPYFLVWDNLRFPDLRFNDKAWPYQVVRLDAIRYSSQQAKN